MAPWGTPGGVPGEVGYVLGTGGNSLELWGEPRERGVNPEVPEIPWECGVAPGAVG